jgi:hypothetical protein
MDETFGEHGENEIPFGRGFRGKQRVEAEAANGAQDGLNVAVRTRMLNAEGRGGGEKALTGEGAADEIDEGGSEMGDVAEGFVLDLGADAEGAAEEVRLIELALVGASCCGHMNRARSRRHRRIIEGNW